jgi:choline kinase
MTKEQPVLILMAAGVGSRISRHIGEKPKSLLELDGKPLISRSIASFSKRGINEVLIATGYGANEIMATVGAGVKCFNNPFFRVTNSIASLWFILENYQIESRDVILMNADVFMVEELVDLIVTDPIERVCVYSDSSRIEDADYRLNWEGESLSRYGKNLTNEDTTGEYIGVVKVGSKYLDRFKENIKRMVLNGEYQCWWEDAIYREVEIGINIPVKDVKGMFWSEMDYIEDYNRTLKFIESCAQAKERNNANLE